MMSDNSSTKVVISEQAKNDILIENAIEMVIKHAINHGIKYTADFVKFLAYETDEESVEDIAEFVTAFSDNDEDGENTVENAFNKIDDKSTLAAQIQALKSVIIKVAASQSREVNIFVNLH